MTRAAPIISPARCSTPGLRPILRGDQRTGLGSWSKDDIVGFLKSGHNSGGAAFGSMIDVVNNSTPYLSDADINAIAVYLKSLPATSAAAGLCL